MPTTAAKQAPPTAPTGWLPRPYQRDALDRFDDGLRRQMLIWHRRAGKDNFALNLASIQSQKTVGSYWHLYPTHVQARRAIWNGIDKSGSRFIDQAFPPELRATTRKADMQIEFNNGSMWQLCGSDKYNSLVGANPVGVFFSEWALCDPLAWDYIRPIIRENGGFAVFITTYRGRNHAFRMAKRLRKNPEWYIDVRTVDDTTDRNGNRILTAEDIQAERDEGMSDALIRQEYYCDPIASADGSIYGKALEGLLEGGRFTSISYDSSKPVFASWSLKFDNQYTVIFWQKSGNESRVIGSKTFHFEPLSDCLDYVRTAYPWKYISRHAVGADVPDDAIEFFESHEQVVDKAPHTDSMIKLTRDQVATTWIDSSRRPWVDDDENNSLLIDSLNGFRFSKTRAGAEFSETRANTWEKHFAIAFETYAAWRNGEGDLAGGWHPRPSTAIDDLRAI